MCLIFIIWLFKFLTRLSIIMKVEAKKNWTIQIAGKSEMLPIFTKINVEDSWI